MIDSYKTKIKSHRRGLMKERVRVNGFQIFPFKSNGEFVHYLKSDHWNNILVAMNAEKLIHRDGKLKEIVNQNIGFPDGAGAVFALKRKGIDAVKIAGTEFWLELVRMFHKNKQFYLIGGKQGIIDQTVEKLQDEFPGIGITGYRNGYLDSEDLHHLIADISQKKPDIVFVAMGSPKQEFTMQKLKQHHPALYMGLGGSFDVYTGNVKRAPKVWIDNHMEWAYRLINQPKRSLRQIHLIKFVYKLVFNKL